MILELAVENLAIIERTRIEPGTGFTVLTGETGAGKSLLVDAIQLALGERADTELVRSGAKAAVVSVVFDLADAPRATALCEEMGIEPEEGRLYVERSVAAHGRSVCRINGRPVPVANLRRLGATLIDLHGQHDNQSLLDPRTHVDTLDEWIGRDAMGARVAVAASHAAWRECERRLRALREGMRDLEQKSDLLRFQIAEIEETDPQPGEWDELEARLGRLKHAERITTAVFGALGGLSDDEGCAVDVLGDAVRLIEGIVRFDPTLEARAALLRSALVETEEAARDLRAYADALDADPAELEVVAARMDRLKRLRRKYGADEAEILAHLARVRGQLAEIESPEETEEAAAQAEARARVTLEDAAARLTAVRQARAGEIAANVQAQLRDLAMSRAEFDVRIRPRSVDAEGGDDVEFLFTANPGEPVRPLAKIASGGEIARVMLAIKTALAGRAGVPTLIFDEVDAGMGGRTAATVGRKLAELGRHAQVLSISHLPQVAAQASAQWRIEKSEREGRSVTEVRLLPHEERVEEIARMLAGDALTAEAVANARRLLDEFTGIR